MKELVDFGAPSRFGAHHFFVVIPPAPREAVTVCEDFGFEGDDQLRETTVVRAIVARDLWTRIRDEARRDFNLRLRERKHRVGTWNQGKTKLDRFLGKELCVLVWAAEHATPEECPVICQRWLDLRPEERWWLYAKTAAGAGRAEDAQHGWRKALYCALSDATGVPLRRRVAQKRGTKSSSVPAHDLLFEFVEKGGI
jgi:hypothetical protein